jgi:hypothetical protein
MSCSIAASYMDAGKNYLEHQNSISGTWATELQYDMTDIKARYDILLLRKTKEAWPTISNK